MLSLQIYDTYKYSKGTSYNVTDTETELIEDRMRDFISKLLKVSVKEEMEADKNKLWHQQYEQEQKILEEKRLKEKMEKDKFERSYK